MTLCFLHDFCVNLRSASAQTRLVPFPSIIRLVSPSAAAAAATAIPKDEFPQVSGEQEQRTEDAGDEQEEEACVVRKLPDQTASFFCQSAKLVVGEKLTLSMRNPHRLLLIVVRWVRISEEL